MKRYRAIIVDDERLARRDLLALLKPFTFVEVVAEADSVATAASRIEASQPDLMFLDVQLGRGSGFDVLEKTERATRVIFVTAHERFAVRAFDVNALDYLLKPVDPARLRDALARLDTPKTRDELPPLQPDDQFCGLDGSNRGFVAVRAIRRVSADGNYTRVHTSDGRELEVKQSLLAWERRLPQALFVRINRNDIVQLGLITQLVREPAGGYAVRLLGEPEARSVSRRALGPLRERLAHH